MYIRTSGNGFTRREFLALSGAGVGLGLVGGFVSRGLGDSLVSSLSAAITKVEGVNPNFAAAGSVFMLYGLQ